MQDTNRLAYDAGLKCGLGGNPHPLQECPFETFMPRSAWLRGWDEGMRLRLYRHIERRARYGAQSAA